jgi:hypothetical protein
MTLAMRGLGGVVVAALLCACGNAYYWQQTGRAQPEFERDSTGCAGNALRAAKHEDKEALSDEEMSALPAADGARRISRVSEAAPLNAG